MSPRNLQPLLEPRSIAVIGASGDASKPGNVLLRNLLAGGFPGTIVPVNRRGGEICGLPAVTSISEAPAEIDLAYVILPRHLVLEAAQECAARGVKALAVMAAGFAEADDWGRKEQERLSALAAEYDIPVIGPNAIGMVTMGGAQRGTFVQFDSWRDGRVAIGAQSGVFAGAIAQREMTKRVGGLGIRHSVSMGNKSGVTEVDLLAAFADDPTVGVIGLYLESLADPAAFFELAARVKRVRPVVVLKAGRTQSGARASAAHTGSLMTDDAVFDQLARQHGIVRAQDEEEFVAFLDAFSKSPVPSGPGVGLLTLSGALGVIAADLASAHGLEVAEYRAETLGRLAALVPDWQAVGNPADLWTGVDRDPRAAIIDGLDAALGEPGVDQVLGVLLADPVADFEGFREAFAELIAAHPDTGLHLVVLGTLAQKWTEDLDALDVSLYPSTRLAITTMAAMARYAAQRDSVPTAYQRLA